MITDKEREDFKEIIGASHISKISAFFIERGIKAGRSGTYYSSVFISRVFNAYRGLSNPTIEKGIWEYLRHLKELKEEQAALLEDLKKNNNE